MRQLKYIRDSTIQETNDNQLAGVTSRPQLADRQFHEKLVSRR